MDELKERLRAESGDVGRGIIKVDSFLNHQIDPALMQKIGAEFARLFGESAPTKIMTVETGGIAPALATAMALDIPLIIARTRRAAGMPRELLQESTLSQTRNQAIDLFVSPEFLSAHDRLVLIDDFLTNAQMMLALCRLVERGGARVVGIGAVIEKAHDGGRAALEELNLPVKALVRIANIAEGEIEFVD
jgi:xanthine phosphoribosyltransferase